MIAPHIPHFRGGQNPEVNWEQTRHPLIAETTATAQHRTVSLYPDDGSRMPVSDSQRYLHVIHFGTIEILRRPRAEVS